jgi:tRNA threonylcarbamoyladenosine dehydratase
MDFLRRFGGLQRLYGVVGAGRIFAGHIVVVGIGGVGSWAVEALARSGVGHLTLIDLDHVSESNINRQVHALDASVGQAKVQAMRERIAQINPECQVTCIEAFVEPGNWPGLLSDALLARTRAGASEAVSGVIDACDQAHAKTALAAWAMQSKVPFVSVGAAGGKRHAHRVDMDDLSRVTHDPLLAQLRNRLRKLHGAPREGKNIGVTCVFSRESVMQPDASDINLADGVTDDSIQAGTADGSLNCHGYGSVVSVTATFGQCAAGWLMDQISKIDHLAKPTTENRAII